MSPELQNHRLGGGAEQEHREETHRRAGRKAAHRHRIDHIIPEIGKIPLNKLMQTDLQQFYARLKRNGRKQYVEKYGTGLSDRMVRACHASCRMALENGMDMKTLSATIGHVSAATILDIYSHMTDTMQMQAAVSIDHKIGKTDARMPTVEQTTRRSGETTRKRPV